MDDAGECDARGGLVSCTAGLALSHGYQPECSSDSIISISFFLRGPVTAKPDKELACQLKQGDPDALAAAYDQFGLYAYSLLVRVTHNPATAEDLMQELFLRIWTRIGDYDSDRTPLKMWISVIARNLAIDSTRLTRRLSERQVPFAIELRAGRHNQRESILQDEELIRKALCTLTAKQKQLLEMVYFEGCSHSEVAKRLETPLGTVKGRHLASLRQLRKWVILSSLPNSFKGEK